MTTATRYIGTCPVCYGEHKLHKMRIVHHGYRRPHDGHIHGDCFGVGWEPFELSPDGTIAFVERVLQPDLTGSEEFLQRLLAGEITELRVEVYLGSGRREWKPVYRGEPAFRGAERTATINTENHVRHLKQDIAERTRKVAGWHKEPVRTEEEVVQAKASMTSARRAQIESAREARRLKREALDNKERARQQERADLIREYRDIFEDLAREPDTLDARAEARRHWIQMHKRQNKKRYLRFYPHKLEADAALQKLGLAVPYSGRVGMSYANDLGWEPRP